MNNVKQNLVAKTPAEKLILFMYRYAYTQKQVADVACMHPRTFGIKLKHNNFHPDELRRMNNKLTLKRGIRL